MEREGLFVLIVTAAMCGLVIFYFFYNGSKICHKCKRPMYQDMINNTKTWICPGCGNIIRKKIIIKKKINPF